MTKPVAPPLFWKMDIPEVRRGKAAEAVEQLIPYQMRNMHPRQFPACASWCALPLAGLFLLKIRMLSNTI